KDEKEAVADALDTITLKIAAAEQQLRQEQDRTSREREAAKRRQQVERLREALRAHQATGKEVAEALEPLVPVALEIANDAAATTHAQTLVAVGGETAVAVVTSYIARMIAGAPIVGPTPAVAVAAPKPAPPAIDRLGIMVFQNSKWVDPGGEVRTCAKHGL